MKKKLFKDKIRRKCSASYEFERLKHKYVLSLPLHMAYKRSIETKLNALGGNNSKTRIKNYCMFTARSRGVYKHFHLSRMMFKELALAGRLPGIRKSSW